MAQHSRMSNDDLCRVMQKYLGLICSSGSAFWGRRELEKPARRFFRKIELSGLSEISEFNLWLDSQTCTLCKRFPKGCRDWGFARKILNIFLRHACYNVYLRNRYHLEMLEPFLEVPIDSIVADKLRRKRESNLPRWRGYGAIDAELNRCYQQVAQSWANEKGFARVHLDAWIWGGRL